MKLFFAGWLCLVTCISQAQQSPIDEKALGYFQTALEFARPTSPMGTARIQGLAGASIALGADITNVTTNPAGLGLFTKGEVSFSMGMNFNYSDANYIETNTTNDYPFFKFSTAGAVIHFPELNPAKAENGYKGSTIALSFMRTNNFQREFSYQGTNDLSTLADFFVENANGRLADSLIELSALAYDSFVINPFIDDPSFYYTEFRDPDNNLVAPINQSETVRYKGGYTQFNVAYGGNWNDRLYLGAGVGVGIVNYRLQTDYTESLSIPASDGELQSFTLDNGYKIEGASVGFNLGAIYRPTNWLRVGGSLTTPYFHTLIERDSSEITAFLAGFLPETNFTLPSEFRFRYRTPWKTSLGAAFFIQKYGFITIDADYVFYNTMNLKDNLGKLPPDNRTIKNLFEPSWNLRAGAEGRIGFFRIRGGTAYYQSPLNINPDGVDRNIFTWSAGLGIRLPTYYIDLALTSTSFNEVYNPYVLSTGDFYSVTTKHRLVSVNITTGFLFTAQ